MNVLSIFRSAPDSDADSTKSEAEPPYTSIEMLLQAERELPVSTPKDAIKHLRKVQKDLNDRRADLEREEANVQRLRGILADADVAEAALKDAEAQAAAAADTWGRKGAFGSPPDTTVVEAARRAAQAARLRARGAELALDGKTVASDGSRYVSTHTTEACNDAELAVEYAAKSIRPAVRAVLLSEATASGDFAKADELIEALRLHMQRLAGLYHLDRDKFGATELGRLYRTLESVLNFSRDELDEFAEPWFRRQEKLLKQTASDKS